VGGKREGRIMEGIELTKVKYTLSKDTLRNPFEHLNLGINTEKN
jgi:hypothetical protein